MNFQPIQEAKITCEDFQPCFLDKRHCKLSSKCMKVGYWLEPNICLCTGVKMSLRPPKPTPKPPKKFKQRESQ